MLYNSALYEYTIDTDIDITDLALVDLEFESDLEGEEQFVFLEDAGTAVVVHVVRVCVGDVSQSLAEIRIRQTLVQ